MEWSSLFIILYEVINTKKNVVHTAYYHVISIAIAENMYLFC
jgi:hypothetical protein